MSAVPTPAVPTPAVPNPAVTAAVEPEAATPVEAPATITAEKAKPAAMAAKPMEAAVAKATASETSNTIPVPAPANANRAGMIVPMAAAIAFAAGLAGVGGLALRGSNTEAMNRLAAMESTLSSITGELAAIKAQTASLATPPKVSVSLAPVLTRIDSLGEAVERAQKDHQSRLAALASGERGSDKAMSEKLGALNTRLERMEKAMTTGSLPATSPAAAGAQPLPPKAAEINLPRLPGYVLHEVENGVAVIEDRRGVVHEIMRGELLPGVGRIQKIERRAGTWVAVTDKGVISAR